MNFDNLSVLNSVYEYNKKIGFVLLSEKKIPAVVDDKKAVYHFVCQVMKKKGVDSKTGS